MPDGHRRILTVLAQSGGSSSKSRTAILSNYSADGGGFNNSLSKMRTAGYLQGSETLTITSEGIAALGAYTPLPTGVAAFDYWKTHPKVGKCGAAIITALLKMPGFMMTKEHLATATNYEITGGGFNNSLSALRTLGLIEGSGTLKLIVP